jgi:ketosteroid isomerase-like protein
LLLLTPAAFAAESTAPSTSTTPTSAAPATTTPAATARAQAPVSATAPAKTATIMEANSNRQKAEQAFRAWQDGTAPITDILADNLRWTIVGHSAASKTYNSRKQFIDEVLQPFGARFAQRFRPVNIRGIFADGDTVVVMWDGEGTRLDGKPYKNTYAWFMRFDNGLVVEATAFYDSISFNQLWSEVTPPKS